MSDFQANCIAVNLTDLAYEVSAVVGIEAIRIRIHKRLGSSHLRHQFRVLAQFQNQVGTHNGLPGERIFIARDGCA